MPDIEDNPLTPSSDYAAMAPFWAMVSAILCGAEALRETVGGNVSGPHVPYANLSTLKRRIGGPVSPYLPQFPNETPTDYEIRRQNAPLTNIYADISNNLASKPFSKTCELVAESGEDLKKLSENIDGQGNNLHVFARECFKAGLDKAIHWILVDYTRVPQGATLADERSMGARPYWVHIPAERMLAVYSVFFGGQEVITNARIFEPATRRVGYQEEAVRRVRILNRDEIVDDLGNLIGLGAPTWELYEEQESKDASGKKEMKWIRVGGGPITVGEITLVPYMTGKRDGTSWRIDAPLRDLAHMQIEEFQQESNLKTVKELTAFPMLAANGIPTKDDKGEEIVVPVGPRAVLFAPPSGDGTHGEWKFVEPSAASLTFLQVDLEKQRTEMRDLGMQPMATANLTVVTTANVSMKAHSAVQAWALGLKDALEQAWKLTCLWLGQKGVEPEVNVFTDFGVDLEAGSELDAILKGEAQGIFSKQHVAEEFKRRAVSRDSFDWKENQKQIAEEQQGLVPEQPIDPVTGEPIVPPPSNVIPLNTAPKRPLAGALDALKKRQRQNG